MGRKREQGVTLLEVILVLTIGASLIAVGVRQYQQYKFSSDAAQVKTNVDRLFQAASYFYQVQCRANRKNVPSDDYTLAPTVALDSLTPVAINIKTDLIDTGYLADAIPYNPMVDSSPTTAYDGYRVQFVPSTQPRDVCTDATTATTDPYSLDCASNTMIGTIVNWQIQVSAALEKPADATIIANITAADCLSSSTGTDSVVDCANAGDYATVCEGATATMGTALPGSPEYIAAQTAFSNKGCGNSSSYGDFLSFQRSPTFSVAPEGQSGLGMTEKTLQQFKQMYETANINYLTNVSHSPEYQYFNCGS